MEDTTAVSRLLDEVRAGDQEALGKLIPLVYGELRRLAAHYMQQERPDHTLRTTALIHEAYLRLVGRKHLRLAAFEWSARFPAAVIQRVFPFEFRKPREVSICGAQIAPMLDGECCEVCVCDQIRRGLSAYQHMLEYLPMPCCWLNQPGTRLVDPTLNSRDSIL
jgi:hypothetical protein